MIKQCERDRKSWKKEREIKRVNENAEENEQQRIEPRNMQTGGNRTTGSKTQMNAEGKAEWREKVDVVER